MADRLELANEYWLGFAQGREEALQEAIKIAHRNLDNQLRALTKAREMRSALLTTKET